MGGSLWIQGQPSLQSKFMDCQGCYTKKPCLGRKEKLKILLQFFFNFLFYMYAYSICMYAYTLHACIAHEGQKRVLDPLGLELQMAVSHVGTGNWIWYFGRVASALNHRAIFPTPGFFFFSYESAFSKYMTIIHETFTVYPRVLFAFGFEFGRPISLSFLM